MVLIPSFLMMAFVKNIYLMYVALALFSFGKYSSLHSKGILLAARICSYSLKKKNSLEDTNHNCYSCSMNDYNI
jgi:hypothetical protein